MTAFQLFQAFNAIRLHLSSDTYDCVKYKFHTKSSPMAFSHNRSRYFFEKWARKIDNQNDVFDFLVGNFVENHKWISEFDAESGIRFRKKLESFEYVFASEVDKIILLAEQNNIHSVTEWFTPREFGHPFILSLFFQKEIERETMIIIGNLCTDGFQQLDDHLKDDIVWKDTKFHCQKYWKLFELKIKNSADKYKNIFKKVCKDREYKLK